MNQTFTLPTSLVNDIDMLKRNWGLGNLEETIKHLLKLAVAREKKFSLPIYTKIDKRPCASALKFSMLSWRK